MKPGNLGLMHHRGPDARGEWSNALGNLWLGHTRLAIQDLSPRGAQPMTDPATGNVIVFNGEIYNHLQVRQEISGATWRGQSDTETLLAAYRQWGEQMLEKLKGMFAFVIYDPRKEALFIARDRLGIKPLYYRRNRGRWSVASEIRMLRNGSAGVSPETLSSFLKWGAIPDEGQFGHEVSMLPAGHFLWVDQNGKGLFRRYWPKATIGQQGKSDDAATTVRKLLDQSVNEHLLADVPVSCFLSGGIDSGIIVALASQNREFAQRLHTFTLAFANRQFDESSIAAKVAERWGCRHTQVELGEKEILGLVAEAVDKLDAPSVDAINNYIVCRTAAAHGVKVALSGLGADELFGGYPIFNEIGVWRKVGRIPQVFRSGLGWFGPRGQRLAELPEGNAVTIAFWRRQFWSDALLESAGLPVPKQLQDPPPSLPDEFSQLSWAELTGYMRPMLLRDADQMSMAVSMELRVPFLDHELVEYVLGLPQEVKQGKGLKGLLVEACRDLLIEEHFRKTKMGFGLPMREWMRKPLRDYVKAGLDHAAKVIPRKTLNSVEAQFEANQLHWTRLWSVVVMGHYLHRDTCAS